MDPFPIIAPRDPFPITTYYECMSIRFPLYANATHTYRTRICNHTTTTHTYTSSHMYLITCSYIHLQPYVKQRIMYLPRSHIENTSQKHAKHTTNCNTAKSKACLTKPFEKTEIKWSPYLGKHSQQATFTQHYVLPKTSNGQSIHRFQTQCNETTSKPQKL